MNDETRAEAVEAACIAFTSDDMPTFSRWLPDEQAAMRANMARAIAAYERAMWRPASEAPNGRALIVCDGRTIAEAFREDDGRWTAEFARYAPTHFRPLPAGPED